MGFEMISVKDKVKEELVQLRNEKHLRSLNATIEFLISFYKSHQKEDDRE